MEPEKLKQIAEGMGYEAEIRDKDFTYEHVVIAGNSHVGIKWLKYNPLTNNDQMVEIMEKALEINELVEFEKFTDKYYMLTDETT